MKNFGRIFASYVLILTLTLSVFAGDMSTPLASPQPAPTPAETQGETTASLDGTIHTGAPGDMHTGESVAVAVMGVVQTVLSLL